jgi:uncharacterized membrane protein
MALGQHKHAVGVFSNRQAAESAINELKRSGFSMNKVSIIARNADRQDDIAGVDVKDRNRVGNKADEGAATGALTGGTLGGITGLLVGLGSLAIPGIGPVMVAGEIATVLATTVAGGAIGAAAGGLIGALIGLGIPEERARIYSDRVARGDYLLIVNGTDEEIARAEAILNNRGIEELGIYDSRTPGSAYSNRPTTGDFTDRPVDTAMPMAGGFTDRPIDYTAVTGMPAGYTTEMSLTPGTYATTPMTGGMDRALERQKRAVGVFTSRRDAEYALNELKNSGFLMDKVNVVNKNADRNDEIAGVDVKDRAGNKADEGAVTGAVTGGALGGIGGLLVGLGALAIPGIGPVMLAGATATAIATALSGGAIGAAAGSLVGALIGLGIPEERAKVYNERLSRGDYLVFVDGTEDEIRRAEAILSNRGIQEWGIYDASDAETSRSSEYVASDTPGTSYETNVTSTDPKVIIVDHREPNL